MVLELYPERAELRHQGEVVLEWDCPRNYLFKPHRTYVPEDATQEMVWEYLRVSMRWSHVRKREPD